MNRLNFICNVVFQVIMSIIMEMWDTAMNYGNIVYQLSLW